jgi:Na+-translocating ferredoxin:NAD+ oxidoreductase subunit A
MGELLIIALGAALINNVVLHRFLGLCPVLGAGSRADNVVGMAAATTLVLVLTSVLTWCLEQWVLTPLQLPWLRIVGYIVVVASTVQGAEIVIRRTSPLLQQRLGVYLPLITTNCAVLGVALLNTGMAASFTAALALGIGAGLGFSLVLLLFSGLQERINDAEVPVSFRGGAIALVTAGLLALAFMGFTGMGRG